MIGPKGLGCRDGRHSKTASGEFSIVMDCFGPVGQTRRCLMPGYQSIVPLVATCRRVLVILWDPHYPNVERPTEHQVEQAIFGSGRSARNYFAENSDSRFGIVSAGVFGWYEADHPLDWYDGSVKRDKCGAAIKAAARDVNFQQFDANHDGVITPDELLVVFAHPGGGQYPGGLVRGGDGDRAIRDPDTGDYLKIGGVRLIRDAVEVDTGMPANPSAVIHELLHLFGGLGDMYFWFFTSTGAGPYSVMDQHWLSPHIDPFQKLKLGWLDLKPVTTPGWYSVPDVETRHEALFLTDAARGLDEYFLVENRWPDGSFDSLLPDRGIAVWHIMENPADYSSTAVPPFTDAEQWALAKTQWPRSAIRMIRPVITPPYRPEKALWDGSDPETGYDLLSADPNPEHPSLKWGDGTPSGFELHFTAPAADGRVLVARVPDPCPALRERLTRVERLIEILRDQMEQAPPQERMALLRELGRRRAEAADLSRRLREAGCL